MPTYDYKCSACDHRWELIQPITSNPVRKCPECGRLKAERVIGPGAGIIFKGSGFYQTDYRSESYKKSAEADRKAQDTSGKSESSGKSDSSSSSATASASSTASSGGKSSGGGSKSEK